jgi:hypothetical protein
MRAEKETTNQIELPRFRVIRGFDGVVRVDILKAQSAMKHAMVVRQKLRALDEERNKLINSHGTR